MGKTLAGGWRWCCVARRWGGEEREGESWRARERECKVSGMPGVGEGTRGGNQALAGGRRGQPSADSFCLLSCPSGTWHLATWSIWRRELGGCHKARDKCVSAEPHGNFFFSAGWRGLPRLPGKGNVERHKTHITTRHWSHPLAGKLVLTTPATPCLCDVAGYTYICRFHGSVQSSHPFVRAHLRNTGLHAHEYSQACT